MENKYKTGWRRVLAALIDGVLLLYSLHWISIWIFSSNLPLIIKGIYYCYWSFSRIIYSVYLHGKFGQTLGKKLVGVRLEDLSGSKISWRQAILRDIPDILICSTLLIANLFDIEGAIRLQLLFLNNYLKPSLMETGQSAIWEELVLLMSLAWLLLEFFSMMFNSKRRAVQDYLAGTVVVRTKI